MTSYTTNFRSTATTNLIFTLGALFQSNLVRWWGCARYQRSMVATPMLMTMWECITVRWMMTDVDRLSSALSVCVCLYLCLCVCRKQTGEPLHSHSLLSLDISLIFHLFTYLFIYFNITIEIIRTWCVYARCRRSQAVSQSHYISNFKV